ncbi:MAG: shufflon system plasmid conjugative transfer pilus tip adhesin PilV [Alphaproteobacteria bacterium]
MQMRLMREKGRMLLEVLLVLVIIAGLLPFIYRQNMKKKENLENATVAAGILKVKSVFETYLEEKAGVFDSATTTQTKVIDFKELYEFGLPESVKQKNRFDMKYILVAQRKILSLSQPQIRGLILAIDGNLPLLQERKIANLLGPQGGYIEDNFIYGSHQSWMMPLADWALKDSLNGVVVRTEVTADTEGYIYRKDTNQKQNHEMHTNLYMGYHNIENIGMLKTESIQVFESFSLFQAIEESTSGDDGQGITVLELQNTEKDVDLDNCKDDEEESSCPTIQSIEAGEINIMGNALIEGDLKNEEEGTLFVKEEIVLDGELNVDEEFSVYRAKINNIEIQQGGVDEDMPLYDFKAKNTKIDKLQISNLQVLNGVFESVAGLKNVHPIGCETGNCPRITETELKVKDIVLQDLNRWIYSNRTDCEETENTNCSSSCSSAADCTGGDCCTDILFDCLTDGFDYPGGSYEGKTIVAFPDTIYSYNPVERKWESTSGFIDSVRISDIYNCLKEIKEISENFPVP